MKRYLPFVIVALAAIVTVAGATIFYRAKHAAANRVVSNERSESDESQVHVRGNPKARVTLEEFGDYQCPPCGKLAAPIRMLEYQYGEQLCLVFRHFPLINHNHAKDAAYAAEAAARQGKFWEMHDQLYREQANWTQSENVKATFKAYAALLGMDQERFEQDMNSEAVKETVEADQRQATKLGVTSTPTIFVNNRAVSMQTMDPVKMLREAIEGALKPAPSS